VRKLFGGAGPHTLYGVLVPLFGLLPNLVGHGMFERNAERGRRLRDRLETAVGTDYAPQPWVGHESVNMEIAIPESGYTVYLCGLYFRTRSNTHVSANLFQRRLPRFHFDGFVLYIC
jgi:hypothetical protein